MFLALYGTKVNIGEAVFISIFSMAVVFVVLLIISYMIDIVAAVINKGKKKVSVKTEAVSDTLSEPKVSDNTVAIIAAAIAAYEGTNVENLVIKKIRRVKNSHWRI